MIDILNSYLVQHKSINIPGLGTIYIQKLPAQTDFVNKKIYPPQYSFTFDKYFDAPAKDFFTYLAMKKSIPDYEAIQLYNDFSQHLRSKIKMEDSAEWNDVGVFKKDKSGEIVLEPICADMSLYHPVYAERIVRSNAAHAILVGDKESTNVRMTEFLNEANEKVPVKRDYWWINALTLFAIALTMLIIHFIKYGFTSHSLGNRQSVEWLTPNNR
ncbi:MAG: hypothetical protein WKF97_16830 [Chitinophagaceae bacterium]